MLSGYAAPSWALKTPSGLKTQSEPPGKTSGQPPALLYRAPTHRPAFCCHPEPLEGRFRATAVSLDSF